MRLQLYRPLKQLTITQNFGENNACIKNDGTGNIISRSSAVCPTGYQSVYKYHGMNGHNGLDFGARDWELVFASCEGIVNEVSTETARGLGVGTITEQKYEVNDTYTKKSGSYTIKIRYWHLAGLNVKVGDKVKVGQVIGWADNTGYSTGSHLHWEAKAVENGVNVWQDNKFLGAFDPLPYLQNLSAYEKNTFMYKIKAMLADLASQIESLLLKK